MGRKLVICGANLTYHTFSRCVNHESMMRDDRVKELMLIVIQETIDLFNFEFSGFEILDDHFHFIIRTVTGGENISKIMQRIKSVFARRYNKMHGRTGPLWNERYGYTIIEHAEDPACYLLHLLWYMAYNSFRKNRVNNPRDSKYSSIHCYLNEQYQSKVTITLHQAFISLGNTFDQRLQEFLLYEKKYLYALWYQRF